MRRRDGAEVRRPRGAPQLKEILFVEAFPAGVAAVAGAVPLCEPNGEAGDIWNPLLANASLS